MDINWNEGCTVAFRMAEPPKSGQVTAMLALVGLNTPPAKPGEFVPASYQLNLNASAVTGTIRLEHIPPGRYRLEVSAMSLAPGPVSSWFSEKPIPITVPDAPTTRPSHEIDAGTITLKALR